MICATKAKKKTKKKYCHGEMSRLFKTCSLNGKELKNTRFIKIRRSFRNLNYQRSSLAFKNNQAGYFCFLDGFCAKNKKLDKKK